MKRGGGTGSSGEEVLLRLKAEKQVDLVKNREAVSGTTFFFLSTTQLSNTRRVQPNVNKQ
jgi:hypothetical protein